MIQVLKKINGFVWGVPALCMILLVGFLLSKDTGLAQLRLFPAAIRSFFKKLTVREKGNGISPFQSLCTALAATVGTGNIAGVAGALCIGGPGAVFWLWVSALLGMIIKFAEATLCVRYQRTAADRRGHGAAAGCPCSSGNLEQRFLPQRKPYRNIRSGRCPYQRIHG